MPETPDSNFWNPQPVERLAADQGITKPQSLDELTGAAADLWESDEDFERFLKFIDRPGSEASAA